MSRTAYRTSIKYPVEQTYQIIENTLQSKHYHEYNYKGESVWKEGIGMATAMHYIKISFLGDDLLQITGWVQIGLGSAGLPEQDLSGVVAVLPKKQVQSVIAGILGSVSADPAILANPSSYVNAHSKDFYPDLPGSVLAAVTMSGFLTIIPTTLFSADTAEQK